MKANGRVVARARKSMPIRRFLRSRRKRPHPGQTLGQIGINKSPDRCHVPRAISGTDHPVGRQGRFLPSRFCPNAAAEFAGGIRGIEECVACITTFGRW